MDTLNKTLQIVAKEQLEQTISLREDMLEEELVLEQMSSDPRFFGPDYEELC